MLPLAKPQTAKHEMTIITLTVTIIEEKKMQLHIDQLNIAGYIKAL